MPVVCRTAVKYGKVIATEDSVNLAPPAEYSLHHTKTNKTGCSTCCVVLQKLMAGMVSR